MFFNITHCFERVKFFSFSKSLMCWSVTVGFDYLNSTWHLFLQI